MFSIVGNGDISNHWDQSTMGSSVGEITCAMVLNMMEQQTVEDCV